MNTGKRFNIIQLTRTDENLLKEFYAEKVREGNIQINLERSPDFFNALEVEGFENGVFAVSDLYNNAISAISIRSLRKCFINGEVKNIGYLSSLRVAGKYRKSPALFFIFNKLRQLYMQSECPGYLCSVFNNNKNAMQVFTSGKAGIPEFRKVGEYNTFVFKPIKKNHKKEDDVFFRNAKENDIAHLLKHLNSEGQHRQYFPYYTQNDFENKTGLLRDIKLNNISLAIKNNQIIGCLALWDQKKFRQWKVDNYSTPIRISRPLLNLFFKLLSLPELPKTGKSFNNYFLSMVCIQKNNQTIFSGLLNHAIENIPSNEKTLITAGLFNNDPLINALPNLKFTFKSTIFICFWNETKNEIDKIDQRLPYLEIGSI